MRRMTSAWRSEWSRSASAGMNPAARLSEDTVLPGFAGVAEVALAKRDRFTGENTVTGYGVGSGESQDVNVSSLTARLRGSDDQVVLRRL